ncbi:RluA family pseudouridine synthase [Alkalibacterium psychrotolerans]
MRIDWYVEKNIEDKLLLKSFLKRKYISKRFLSKVKYRGGNLQVNDKDVRVREELKSGDKVSVFLPREEPTDHLAVSHEEVEVLYEDSHYLIVNKPSGVASVPSSLYPNHTVANRVKGYILEKGYYHQTIHIVNRLDKDTSGVMLFAKHSLAHSYLDRLLQNDEVYKEYVAFVHHKLDRSHDIIEEPIARASDSIIKRRIHSSGKSSKTEYWILNQFEEGSKVKIQLHTGRTHQIRVHFSHIGHPLMGDTLYGPESNGIDRQALHCVKVSFCHPFTHQQLTVVSPLPADMASLENNLKK